MAQPNPIPHAEALRLANHSLRCHAEGQELALARALIALAERAERMEKALHKAKILCGICSDWNLDMVEIEIPNELKASDGPEDDDSLTWIGNVEAYFDTALKEPAP